MVDFDQVWEEVRGPLSIAIFIFSIAISAFFSSVPWMILAFGAICAEIVRIIVVDYLVENQNNKR